MAQQVAPPVGPASVGHRCGVPPAVRAQYVAALSPLELVAIIFWQVFSPLELADEFLEVGGHPNCPFFHVGRLSAL